MKFYCIVRSRVRFRAHFPREILLLTPVHLFSRFLRRLF